MIDLVKSPARRAHAKQHSALETSYHPVTEQGHLRAPGSPLDHSRRKEAVSHLEPEEFTKPQAGEIYRHYKGDLYLIKGIGIDEETQGPRVDYVPCYQCDDLKRLGGDYWSRPLGVFMAVLPDGRRRFELFRESEDQTGE